MYVFTWHLLNMKVTIYCVWELVVFVHYDAIDEVYVLNPIML